MKRALAIALLPAAILAACTGVSTGIVQTLQTAWRSDAAAEQAVLNPSLRYLRVVVGGRVVLLVLGNVESDPQGPIEVWYSAQREVLRLQNGRVAGAVGLTTEWRSVSIPQLVSWSELARTAAPARWVRTRDVMPGYRFGVRDELLLSLVPAPAKSALQGIDPQRLTWFEERLPSTAGDSVLAMFVRGANPADQPLPPARYAVDLRAAPDIADRVVYGEQCLAAELCFSWQRWPVALPAAGAR